jgi:hypothetical protein
VPASTRRPRAARFRLAGGENRVGDLVTLQGTVGYHVATMSA